MQKLETIAGKTYVVSSPNGGTVTSADGLVKEDVEAGKQKVVFGTGAPLQLDDDAGKIMATFKLAPAKLRLLGLLGGGESSPSLPAGYLAAEFLESTTGGGRDAAPTIKVVDSSTFESGFDLVYESTTPYTGATWDFAICSTDIGTYTTPPRIFDYKALFRGKSILVPEYSGKVRAEMNWKNNRKLSFEGVTYSLADSGDRKLLPWELFKGFKGRIWTAKITEKDEIIRDLKPCLDDAGKHCFYDKITSTAFYNTDGKTLVLGLTLSQARKLSKLPATGGTLTISLPTGYEADSGVMTALETARANGWTITVQTYEAETASATFGMRRIWVRRTADDNGMYVDADGNRWQVDWCVEMYTPDGSTPDQHGYELYRSVEAAVAYWELTPWVDPEAEELLTNQES